MGHTLRTLPLRSFDPPWSQLLDPIRGLQTSNPALTRLAAFLLTLPGRQEGPAGLFLLHRSRPRLLRLKLVRRCRVGGRLATPLAAHDLACHRSRRQNSRHRSPRHKHPAPAPQSRRRPGQLRSPPPKLALRQLLSLRSPAHTPRGCRLPRAREIQPRATTATLHMICSVLAISPMLLLSLVVGVLF